MLRYLFLFGFLIASSCSLENSTSPFSQLDISECEQTGGENCDITAGNSAKLNLNIKTPNPVESKSTSGTCGNTNSFLTPAGPNVNSPTVVSNTYCWDISGTCNQGIYRGSKIIANANVSGAIQNQNLGSCIRGKFQVQLKLNLLDSELCKSHDLTLELIGLDLSGTEHTNSVHARKKIQFSVPQHPSCT